MPMIWQYIYIAVELKTKRIILTFHVCGLPSEAAICTLVWLYICPANTQHNKHVIVTNNYMFITFCVCRVDIASGLSQFNHYYNKWLLRFQCNAFLPKVNLPSLATDVNAFPFVGWHLIIFAWMNLKYLINSFIKSKYSPPERLFLYNNHMKCYRMTTFAMYDKTASYFQTSMMKIFGLFITITILSKCK